MEKSLVQNCNAYSGKFEKGQEARIKKLTQAQKMYCNGAKGLIGEIRVSS